MKRRAILRELRSACARALIAQTPSRDGPRRLGCDGAISPTTRWDSLRRLAEEGSPRASTGAREEICELTGAGRRRPRLFDRYAGEEMVEIGLRRATCSSDPSSWRCGGKQATIPIVLRWSRSDRSGLCRTLAPPASGRQPHGFSDSTADGRQMAEIDDTGRAPSHAWGGGTVVQSATAPYAV